jgi:hypothetical protein
MTRDRTLVESRLLFVDIYTPLALHHPLAGKQFAAGLSISGWVSQLGVHRRVLDVGVSEPIFDKAKVSAGV